MAFIPVRGLTAPSPLSEAPGATLRLEIWPVLSLTQLLWALFRGKATQVARASQPTFSSLWGHKPLLAAPSSPTACLPCSPVSFIFMDSTFSKLHPYFAHPCTQEVIHPADPAKVIS